MSILLALDTSTKYGSLCLWDNKASRLIAGLEWNSKHTPHSECLVPQFKKLLQTQNFTANQIDAYALGVGPGSFTGVRVGVSFVKSLAYLFNKPVYSISSLAPAALELAHQHPSYYVWNISKAFGSNFYAACIAPGPKWFQKPTCMQHLELLELNDPPLRASFYIGDKLEAKLLPPFKGHYPPLATQIARIAQLSTKDQTYKHFVALNTWQSIAPINCVSIRALGK